MARLARCIVQGKHYSLYPPSVDISGIGSLQTVQNLTNLDDIADALLASVASGSSGAGFDDIRVLAPPGTPPAMARQKLCAALQQGDVLLVQNAESAPTQGGLPAPLPQALSLEGSLSFTTDSVAELDATPTFTKSNEPDTSGVSTLPSSHYKIVVEVAGRDHPSSQGLSMNLSQSASSGERELSLRNDPDTEHRSLAVLSGLPPASGKLFLSIAMQGYPASELLLLSANVSSVPLSAVNKEWDNVLIPVRPLQLRELPSHSGEEHSAAAKLPTSNWCYVFWKGMCWRELEVMENTALRDVRLSYYRRDAASEFPCEEASTRKAEGHWLEEIWIPYKIGGQRQRGRDEVRVALSARQWSWTQIEKLESSPELLAKHTVGLDGLLSYSHDQVFMSTESTDATATYSDLHESVRDQSQRRIAAALVPVAQTCLVRLKAIGIDGRPAQQSRYRAAAQDFSSEGTTDADGNILLEIPEKLQVIDLQLWPYENFPDDYVRYQMQVRALEKVDSNQGYLQRLSNLGIPVVTDEPVSYKEAHRSFANLAVKHGQASDVASAQTQGMSALYRTS